MYLYGRKPNGGTFGVPLPSMRANAEDIMLTPRAGLLPIHEDDRFFSSSLHHHSPVNALRFEGCSI
jgi:hypothetical protein